MTNGVNPHATPLQTPLGALQNRATMATPVPATGPPSAPPSAVPSRPTPKPKTKTTSSSLPAPPLDDVHAAFVEFRAKEEDKVRRRNSAICVGTYKLIVWNSVCLFNVFTASKFARRILVASASICSNALPISA